jgi:D-arabinose 1-dehydrogenase-like Zn-dependent alcohol dehydrogenase
VVADGSALKEIGGADVVLYTSSSHAAAVDAMTGLRPWGKLVLMGLAMEEMPLAGLPLTTHGHQIIGSAHNGLEYLAEAIDIVARGMVEPMVELFPLEHANEAYEKVAAGKVRFKPSSRTDRHFAPRRHAGLNRERKFVAGCRM